MGIAKGFTLQNYEDFFVFKDNYFKDLLINKDNFSSFCILHHIWLDKDYRNNGLGLKIFDRILIEFKSSDIKYCRILIPSSFDFFKTSLFLKRLKDTKYINTLLIDEINFNLLEFKL